MNSLCQVLCFCLVAMLGLQNTAAAAQISFKVCISAETDFSDAGMGDKLLSDVNPSLGVLIRFVDASNTETDVYADDSGSNKGCKNTTLETASGPYTIKVLRKATVNGNVIEVRPDSSSGIYVSTVATNFTPMSAVTYSYTVGVSDSINLLTAAAFAMSQTNGGVTGETYTLYTQDCPGPASGSCAGVGEIYITPGHSDSKRIIAHELGHAVSYAANGNSSPNRSYSAVGGDCSPAYLDDDHKMNSKEFASAAFVEGIAHFYSAIAFNDFDHNDDCVLWKEGIDWDIDGIIFPNDPDDPEQFSCDVGFDADPESIPEFDVLGWYCLDSGDSENRATEYDVLRAFWDLVTYYDQSPETIFDIWAAADTDTWIAAGTGTGGNYPSQRMSEAAYDVGGSGLKVDYDENADYNGILR